MRMLFVAATLAMSAGTAFATGDAGAPAGHAWHIDWFNFFGKGSQGLLWSLINFAVLGLLLRKLFGNALTNFLQTRHTSIKDALEEGRRLREQAQKQLKKYGAKIAGVDAEVAALVATIRKSAEDEKARILANAEAQAAAMKKDAEQRIAAEIARSRRALEREVVNAAISAAEQILRTQARDDDHRRLADSFIASLNGTAAPVPPTPTAPPTTPPTTPSSSSGGAVDDSW